MKFIVGCNDFKNLIGTTSRGLAKQPNAQIVMQITGNEQEPKIKITCQTGSSFFQGDIPIHSIDNFEEKVWGLEYDKIKSIISVLPDTPTNLVFSTSDRDGQTLSLDYLGNHINIKFYENVQVPQLTGEIKTLGRVDSLLFMKSMGNMLKVVENNQVSIDLATGCLHFSLEDNIIKTMATNRYAIAEMKIDFEQEEETNFEQMKMLKLEQGSLLIKQPEANEVLELIMIGNMFGYIDGEGIINVVTLADIRPLDYQPILSLASDENFAMVETGSLKTNLINMGKLNQLEDEVILEASKENIFIKNRQDTLEINKVDNTEELIANNLSEVHELKFHRPTTMDIFGLLSTNLVRLEWGTPGKLVRFVTLDKDNQPIENLIVGVSVHG